MHNIAAWHYLMPLDIKRQDMYLPYLNESTDRLSQDNGIRSFRLLNLFASAFRPTFVLWFLWVLDLLCLPVIIWLKFKWTNSTQLKSLLYNLKRVSAILKIIISLGVARLHILWRFKNDVPLSANLTHAFNAFD